MARCEIERLKSLKGVVPCGSTPVNTPGGSPITFLGRLRSPLLGPKRATTERFSGVREHLVIREEGEDLAWWIIDGYLNMVHCGVELVLPNFVQEMNFYRQLKTCQVVPLVILVLMLPVIICVSTIGLLWISFFSPVWIPLLLVHALMRRFSVVEECSSPTSPLSIGSDRRHNSPREALDGMRLDGGLAGDDEKADLRHALPPGLKPVHLIGSRLHDASDEDFSPVLSVMTPCGTPIAAPLPMPAGMEEGAQPPTLVLGPMRRPAQCHEDWDRRRAGLESGTSASPTAPTGCINSNGGDRNPNGVTRRSRGGGRGGGGGGGGGGRPALQKVEEEVDETMWSALQPTGQKQRGVQMQAQEWGAVSAPVPLQQKQTPCPPGRLWSGRDGGGRVVGSRALTAVNC